MRTLVWEAPRTMAMREQAEPEPQADEVLVKVAYAGICGSELSGYLGLDGSIVGLGFAGGEAAGQQNCQGPMGKMTIIIHICS